MWLASRISSMPPPALQQKLSPRSMRGMSIASCPFQVGLAGRDASSSRHLHLSSASGHFSHLLRIRPYARRLRIGRQRKAPFESTVMPKHGPPQERRAHRPASGWQQFRGTQLCRTPGSKQEPDRSGRAPSRRGCSSGRLSRAQPSTRSSSFDAGEKSSRHCLQRLDSSCRCAGPTGAADSSLRRESTPGGSLRPLAPGPGCGMEIRSFEVLGWLDGRRSVGGQLGSPRGRLQGQRFRRLTVPRRGPRLRRGSGATTQPHVDCPMRRRRTCRYPSRNSYRESNVYV
jgi:hypothetical protein